MENYVAQIGVFVAVFLLLATSLNLVLGFGGIFSLMQAIFYGVGAYATARLVLDLHAPFPLELVGAFVVSALVAAVVGLLIMRLKADLIIIGTLALQLVLSSVFRNWNGVTGGSYGIFGIVRPSLFGLTVSSVPGYALFALAVAAVCFALALRAGHSPFGLALRAQREDAVLASALGHDTVRERIAIFVLAGGIAGVAGGLYAQYVGYIDPSAFDVTQSLSFMTIVVVGGLANLWGTLGAAIILTFLPQLIILIPTASSAAAQLQLVLYGLILLVMVRFWPQGLIREQPAVRARRSGAATAATAEPTLEDLASARVEPLAQPAPAIHIEGASKWFGGIHAVDGVSLQLRPGSVTALIGPNGAGKTTLFNLICGLVPSDAGRISFDQRETTALPPFMIARLGVTRTFQDVRIFGRLTVLENVVFALARRDVEAALTALAQVGLTEHADQLAGSLSYAQQKLLMMGVVLARRDPVVFFDEIAAGLDQRSVHAFAGLIRRLGAAGRTVCLVEHNLGFVWEAADQVFVLDQGRLIASGSPADIQANPRVVEIYFGQNAVAAGS